MARPVLFCACLAAVSAPPALAQIPGTPPQRSGEAAPQGRTFQQPQARQIELPLPVLLWSQPVGNAPARLLGETLLGVDASRLADALQDALKEETTSRLRSLGRDYVSPETLASTGVRVVYDPQALALVLEVETSAFKDLDVFLSQTRDTGHYEVLEPARFAAGVDGSFLLTQQFTGGGGADAQIYLDGFANFGGVDGVYADFRGWANLTPDNGEEALNREQFTLFKDDRTRAIRYSAVDVRPQALPLMDAPNLLGVGLERRYGDIRPDQIIRSLGQRSITLERPATVEIEVNGAMIRRFQANAGRLNINDIPFVELGNDVRIYIEDELGRREIDSFSFSAQENLLAPGVSEFGLAGGALQKSFADGLDWDADDFAATGYYRRGVTPGLTLGAGATIAEDGYVGVAGNLVAGLPHGAGQLDAAWSRIDDPVGGARTGFAVEASYDADFEGFGVDRDELNLRAAYRSEDFANLGDEGAGLERLSATGSYRIRLEQGPVVNLGAGYTRSGDLQDVSLRAGVSHSFGSVSASAAVEHVLRDGGRGDETRILVTASMPLGEDRRVRGAYSSARNRATVEYEKRHQGRVGQYGYALRAEHDDDSVGLYGRADYIANRFDASVTLDHAAPDVGALFNEDSPLVGALRVSSGVAFADGRVGVGRRVGHGFVLVDRHPTLSDSTLSIGDSLGGRPPIVRTDGFGPMVAPLSGDYRFSQVSLNLEDAPLGYDIGSGVYAVQGGARVGARTIVGSDAFYSARGVLQDAQGQPVALQYGRLASLDGSAAFDVFTNSAGIFFASGLKPGAYDLELAGARARIEISPPTQGALIELGAVTLGGGS